jgi:autotransporter-associated beta strand protein
VTLVTDAAIGAAAGATLTIAGAISDDAAPLPLVKVGPGTVVLTGANSYRGNTLINGGTPAINSDANLSDAAGQVTVNNGAKLLVSASTTTARTLSLNTGSIQVSAGVTYTYDDATVSGGFLRGPGTHAVAGTSTSFNGVTALPGNNIVQNGPLLLNNFNSAGTLVSNAPLTWDGGFNLGGGSITVNSTLSTEAFENDGLITVNNGGTLNNSGNDLASTGGSRITINTGGTLQLGGTSMNLHGALAVNNGTISGTTNVHFGSLAKGTGSYGTVNVFDGGTFSPGASPGEVSLSEASFNAGGHYLFEIRDAAGGQGVGLDFMNIAGGLTIAAGSTPNSQFVIDLASLNAANQPGLAANFNASQPQSFVLATAAGGITGFAADLFHVDTSDFDNNLAGGSFNVSQSGNDLLLNFNPGPPGDYNFDGAVNAADYVTWRKTINTQSAYNVWQEHFGENLTNVAAASRSDDVAVPEPAALVLLVLAAAIGIHRGRSAARN